MSGSASGRTRRPPTNAAVTLCALSLAAVTASALLLALGYDPVMVLAAFLRGSGFLPKPSYAGGQGMLSDFLSFLGIWAPMLLASLSVIVGMKAGLFNIGVSGQMLAAGFAATALVGYSHLPAWMARPLVLLIGAAVGGMLGAAAGYLKHRCGIHEIVSTILFNYIVSYTTGFFINTRYVDAITRASRACDATARLTLTGLRVEGLRLTVPLGLPLAAAAVVAVWFFLERTSAGFELRAAGLNREAARYSGVSVGRATTLGMALSGTLAGLAGIAYYLGYYNSIVPKALPDIGYDAIAVALLGGLSPLASVLSSALVTVFQKGNVYMSSVTGAPREIASVLIAVLLFFSACDIYIRRRLERL